MKARSLVIGVLLILAHALAFAQPPVTGERAAAPANLTFGPVTGSPSAEFIFESTKDSKVGTAAVGWVSGSEQFRLAVSGPLSEGSTEPLSLRGLAPGATAQVSWNRIHKRVASVAEQRRSLAMCEPILAEKKKSAEEAVKAGKPETAEPVICTTADFSGLDAAEFDEIHHLYDPGFLIGIDATVSRSTFAFVDDVLDNQTADHDAGGITLRAGVLAPSQVNVFVSHVYSRSHQAAGRPTEICSPIAGTGSTQCNTVVRGAPKKVTRSVTSLELRRFFSASIAMSPALLYDWEDNIFAVEAPIYFLGSGTSPTAGVRFNWRSDTQGLTAVVFVGAAIGLIP